MKKFLLVLVLLFAGCTSVAPPAGFLGDYSGLRKGKYFKQEFVAPGADLSKYHKVKVDPVNLSYFRSEGKNYNQQDVEELGVRMKEAFENRLGEDRKVLKSAELPDKETLVIDAALISVGTPQRAVNVATTILAGPSITKGSAIFEAKVSDGGNKEVVALVAERRKGALDLKSLTVGSFTKYTHAEGAFRAWAGRLANFLRSKNE